MTVVIYIHHTPYTQSMNCGVLCGFFFAFFSDENGNEKNAKVDFSYAANTFFGTWSQYGHAVRSFFLRIEVAINGKRTF